MWFSVVVALIVLVCADHEVADAARNPARAPLLSARTVTYDVQLQRVPGESIGLVLDQTTRTVQDLLDGSPAKESGQIGVGDMLVAIGGTDIRALELPAVGKLMQAAVLDLRFENATAAQVVAPDAPDAWDGLGDQPACQSECNIERFLGETGFPGFHVACVIVSGEEVHVKAYKDGRLPNVTDSAAPPSLVEFTLLNERVVDEFGGVSGTFDLSRFRRAMQEHIGWSQQSNEWGHSDHKQPWGAFAADGTRLSTLRALLTARELLLFEGGQVRGERGETRPRRPPAVPANLPYNPTSLSLVCSHHRFPVATNMQPATPPPPPLVRLPPSPPPPPLPPPSSSCTRACALATSSS
jgi:hypothetical protein